LVDPHIGRQRGLSVGEVLEQRVRGRALVGIDAKRNAARHGVAGHIHFLQTSLLEAVLHNSQITTHESRLFDLIASNPPYIAQSAASELQREVRDHEPASALFGGPTGAEFYARIIQQSAELLRTGGFLVLELGHGSAAHVGGHLSHSPGWTNIRLTNDLAGIPRVISAQRR